MAGLLLRRHLRKRQRQRHFVKFLRQWRAKLEVPSSRGDLALESERLYYHYQQDQVLMAYRRHCPAFNAKVERVSDCFADPLRFRALAFRLASLSEQDWREQEPQRIILGSLDELIAFAVRP